MVYRKYNIDESYFENIDSEAKSYLLGWIISDGTITKSGFSIQIHEKDAYLLVKLKENLCKDLEVKKIPNRKMVRLDVNSVKIRNSLIKLLKLNTYGKKADIVCFPDLKEEFIIPCIRGIFDGDGGILDPRKSNSPQCTISSSSENLKNKIKELINIPCGIDDRSIRWSGNNCLDFLGKIYDCPGFLQPYYSLDRKFYLYEYWSTYVPGLSGKNDSKQFDNFKVLKTNKDAILPSKVRISDSGYDLTIIGEYKKIGKVTLYKTGIKAQLSYGFYLEMVPRSSIIKSGYMLANSIGIIDRTYTGEILVPLIKIDDSAPDIQFPAKLVQLIPKPIVHFPVIEVFSEEDLGTSERMEKGFGSSDK